MDASVCGPTDVAAGPDGSLYIADRIHHRVRKLDPSGIITTIAGTGVHAVTGDGGPAVLADVAYPESVDVGPDGSIYISTAFQVRRIDPSGIISTFAGIFYDGGVLCLAGG